MNISSGETTDDGVFSFEKRSELGLGERGLNVPDSRSGMLNDAVVTTAARVGVCCGDWDRGGGLAG